MRRERPRILRLITRLNAGGPARQALSLARDLPDHGFDHLLVTGRVQGGETDWTHRARKQNLPIEVLPSLGRRIDPGADLRALGELVKLLRRFRPHLVHTHTAKAGVIGRLAAMAVGPTRRVHTFHGHTFYGYWSPLGTFAVRSIEAALARRTSRIIAISPRQKRDLCRIYSVASRGRTVVVPLGRELGPFRNGSPLLKQELDLPAEAQLLGFVGRLAPIKNPLAFVHTIAALPDRVHGVIVGSGDLREAVEWEVGRLGLANRIHRLGYRSDLPDLYASFDLLCLTSKNEGTPMAIIEAFASGTPVVAPAVGGIPDLLAEGPPGPAPGLLLEEATPRRLADACRELLNDPDRRQAMGEAARRRSRIFDLDRLVENLVRLYRELLS